MVDIIVHTIHNAQCKARSDEERMNDACMIETHLFYSTGVTVATFRKGRSCGRNCKVPMNDRTRVTLYQ